MTPTQRTTLRYAGAVAVLYLVAIFGSTWLMRLNPKDDSDPPEGRSGMTIYTDHLTGCQYLFRNSLTPRLDGNGRHVGCKS